MLAIQNAKVYTMTGPIYENGTVLVENGKIAAVGSYVEVPAGCEVIDAGGRMLFPGFVEAHCHLGMVESGIGFEGNDDNECTDPVTPHLRAIDGFNPLDITVEEARIAGVTTACTGPGSGNVVGGQFAAVKTFGKRVDDMILKAPLAMKIAFGENPKRVYNSKGKMPMTRMGTAALLRETLFKAKRYMEQIDRAGGDPSKMPQFDMKLEAMLPVLRGEIPLKAHAHRTDDIFTAIRIAREFGVKITLDHCTEGKLIAEYLAKEGLGAIVGPSFGHRTKFEVREKGFDTPGILSKAGVKVAITTDSPVTPLHYLPLMAGLAAKNGMEPYEALKAITINAAEIVGIADRVGSIEVGKDADLVVYEGHPFETASKSYLVMINGMVVHRA